jgi:hypothetical protein
MPCGFFLRQWHFLRFSIEHTIRCRYAPKEVLLGDAPKEVLLGDAPKEVLLGDAPKEVLLGDAPKTVTLALHSLRSHSLRSHFFGDQRECRARLCTSFGRKSSAPIPPFNLQPKGEDEPPLRVQAQLALSNQVKLGKRQRSTLVSMSQSHIGDSAATIRTAPIRHIAERCRARQGARNQWRLFQ